MMDQFLAEFYGTNKTASAPAPSTEDVEKQATVELFLKAAADQNIDLRSMEDGAVEKLYSNFSQNLAAEKTAAAQPAAPAAKTASEEEKKKEHEKVEEAKKEHEEKHAMAKKAAEADAMGRIMAHSYVQELRKIASTKVAELPPALLAHMKGKEEDGKGEKKEEKHEPPAHEEKKDEKDEKKAAVSALDDVAHQTAVKMAAAEGFDPKECEQKIAAVRILNLVSPDSVKVASAPFEAAVHIRALELLEAAKYPVVWTEAK